MELKDARKYRQLEKENAELKQMLADSLLKIHVLEEVNAKKRGSPSHKRRAVQGVVQAGLCSQRRACRYLGLHRFQPSSPTTAALRLAAASARADRDALAQASAPGLPQAGSSPAYRRLASIRSDNGSEFVARVLQDWLAERQVKTLYIAPGSPWQNGHVESFHGSLRDECLDRELMLSLAEARVVIEDYRCHHNEERPHGGLGYRTPSQAFNEAQTLDTKVANTMPAA